MVKFLVAGGVGLRDADIVDASGRFLKIHVARWWKNSYWSGCLDKDVGAVDASGCSLGYKGL